MHSPVVRKFLVMMALLATPLLSLRANAGDLQGAMRFVSGQPLGVMGIDVDHLKNSTLYRRLGGQLLKEMQLHRKFDEIQNRTGFDVRRHLKSLLVVFPQQFTDNDDSFVLIVEGPINRAKLLDSMRKKFSLTRKSTPAHGEYFVTPRAKGPKLAFRGRYMVVSGDEASLRAALQRSRPSLDRRTVRWRAKRAAGHSDAFIIGTSNPKLRKKLAREDPNLGKLLDLDTELSLRPGLRLSVTAHFQSKKPAENVHGILSKGLDEATTSRIIRSFGFGRFITKIQLRRAHDTLHLDLKLSPAEVRDLVDQIEATISKKKAGVTRRPPPPPPAPDAPASPSAPPASP